MALILTNPNVLESLPSETIIQCSVGELRELFNSFTKQNSVPQEKNLEYASFNEAKKFMGGISSPTLRRVIREHNLRNYSPTNQRWLLKVEELRAVAEASARTRHKTSRN